LSLKPFIALAALLISSLAPCPALVNAKKPPHKRSGFYR
jgi:hypothetical protein